MKGDASQLGRGQPVELTSGTRRAGLVTARSNTAQGGSLTTIQLDASASSTTRRARRPLACSELGLPTSER